MNESRLLDLVNNGRRYLELAGAVEAGRVSPGDREAADRARGHLAKMGRGLRGKMGNELVGREQCGFQVAMGLNRV